MRDKKLNNPKVWGGIGEKNSNNNTQWQVQNRIYDSDYISPALLSSHADYWIVIRKKKD